MGTPLVSICCITYNHEQYIRDALEGFVMQQTNFPFEIVISDDCSKDNTRSIIAEYVNRYPHLFRDISPDKNKGTFNNFRYVQDQARGNYIALCEGDDYWIDPLKLQKQIDILEADKTLIACCTDRCVVDTRGNIIEEKKGDVVKNDKEGRYTLRDFFRNHHNYPTLSVVYRNEYKDEVREKHMQTANAFLGDWTLWICLLMFGDMYYLNEVTCAYRINPTSVTHTANRVIRAKANRDICHKVADVLPVEYADIAEDLRDTRWVWISLVFAYKSEKRYVSMLYAVLMSLINCPRDFLGTLNNKYGKKSKVPQRL